MGMTGSKTCSEPIGDSDKKYVFKTVCRMSEMPSVENAWGICFREHKFAIVVETEHLRVDELTLTFMDPKTDIELVPETFHVIEISSLGLSVIVCEPESTTGNQMMDLEDQEDRFFAEGFLHLVDDTQIPEMATPATGADEERAGAFVIYANQEVDIVCLSSQRACTSKLVQVDGVTWSLEPEHEAACLVLDKQGELIGFRLHEKLVILTRETREILAEKFANLPVAPSARCLEMIQQQFNKTRAVVVAPGGC